MSIFVANAWAATGEAAQPSLLASLAPIILICVVFYFLLIRPQQKQMRQHQDMLGKLKKGDKVVTTSGIFAVVQKIADDGFVTIEVSSNVFMKIRKDNISEVISDKTLVLPTAPNASVKAKNKNIKGE
jgi:preprotein translocase subunit YajC